MLQILLIVPLPEEFEEVLKVFPIVSTERRNDEYLYQLSCNSEVTITAVVLGEAGPTPAAQRSERLLTLCDPSLVVLTGIAGSLSETVRLADVVVAEEIDHYLANSKAIPANPPSEGTFELSISGRSNRTGYPVLQAIRNHKFAAPLLYEQWQKDCLARTTLTAVPPKAFLGRIACGDSVGDSEQFVRFLKDRCNRKYDALEMESSGIVEATTARRDPIPLLILRGISDASQNKTELDRASKGAWRAAAVGNAASYLRHLLLWPDFIAAMTECQSQPDIHDQHVRDVLAFLKGPQ